MQAHPQNGKAPSCCLRGAHTVRADSSQANLPPASPCTNTEGMVFIPAGPFLMGSNQPDHFASDGEGPVRSVQVNEFLIDAKAVTVEKFKRFALATVNGGVRGNHMSV